jgi:hypothetical protein
MDVSDQDGGPAETHPHPDAEPPAIDVWDFAAQAGRLVEIPPTF